MVAVVARTFDDLLAEGHPRVLTIAELYDGVDEALARAFPRRRELRVQGEIQNMTDRTGHCYLDLVDHEATTGAQPPVLKVKCWRRTWLPLKSTLAALGIELQPGMVVVLRGTLELYRPRAELGFVMYELDVTALLGRLAALRAALLHKLRAEGLVDRNRALPVPDLPIRVGLVGSPGTEGFRDFLGQLEASPFGFHVVVAKAPVQGAGAPRAIARAVTRLGRSGLDLIVIVRGGGSKTDLQAFDAEPVARAVASCEVPVWTGVGHSGDESVTDIVANRACITPTECGRELVRRVGEWWEAAVAIPASIVARRSVETLVERAAQDATIRSRLAAAGRQQLHRHRERLAIRSRALASGSRAALAAHRSSATARSARIGPLVHAQLLGTRERIHGWRRLLAAYDVDRQLERGYTITMDENGKVLRTAAMAEDGSVLRTRFLDGTVRSVVERREDG